MNPTGTSSRNIAVGFLVCSAAACLVAGGVLHAAGPVGQPAVGRLELADAAHDGAALESLAAEISSWRLADGSRLEVPTRSVVAWGRCPSWPVGPHLLLADGGVLAGRLESLDDKTAVVRSPSLGRLEMPADAVVGYRGTAASRPAAESTAAAERTVQVDLRNGDRIAARSITLGDGVARIDRDRGRVEIPLDRVVGFDLRPADPRPTVASAQSGPRILVALEDGSRFRLGQLTARDGRMPRACEQIVAVAVDGGCATSLASRAPVFFEQIPTVGPPWPLSRGRTLANDWPRARGLTGFTAVGIHAPARARYRLDRPADRFESLVAIDDSAGQGGSAIVRVLASGGTGEPREVFASPVLRGGDEPIAIRADLAGAREVELVVESADRADVLDRTVWLDPRVVETR
jgi:hypothetical protein